MVLTTKLFTADDLWAMPGDEPWEIWDGELRRLPSAGGRASSIAGNVYLELKLHVRARDVGVVTVADGGYTLFSNPDTVVVPDAAIVRWDRHLDQDVPIKFIPIPPDLAVEVQSPSDELKDMEEKRALYARAGVPLLWWVDPASRTVMVYPLDQEAFTLTEADVLDGGEVLPGLRIPVADIFI